MQQTAQRGRSSDWISCSGVPAIYSWERAKIEGQPVVGWTFVPWFVTPATGA